MTDPGSRTLIYATETERKIATQLASSELAPFLAKLETRIMAHPEQGKREVWVTDKGPCYHCRKKGRRQVIRITEADCPEWVNGRSQMELLYRYDTGRITVEGICFTN